MRPRVKFWVRVGGRVKFRVKFRVRVRVRVKGRVLLPTRHLICRGTDA